MKTLSISLVLAVFVCLIGAVPGTAGEPLDTIRTHVDRVLEVLGDPALQGEDHQLERKQRIKEITLDMFNYYEVSRRTMGNNWKKLNKEQQDEFIDLYGALLLKIYMSRISRYTGQKVEFLHERMLSEKKAEVRSSIITESGVIPVNYRLIRAGERWQVYDVIIEGVSLVKNYRSQFKNILARKSPAQLLELLRRKTA